MSFDLAVWRNVGHRLFAAAEASRYYSELCSRPFQSFVPGREMTEFVSRVAERYRDGKGASDLPWAAEPDISDDCAIMPIQSSLAESVLPIVRDLAMGLGLVCFDPQNSTVYQSTVDIIGDDTQTLELADGRVIRNPDSELVGNSIADLSAKNWFVILERRPNFYLQAGYGDKAGAPGGSYVIEYRGGGPENHWRAVLSNPGELSAAFLDYLQGGSEWVSRFVWSPLSTG